MHKERSPLSSSTSLAASKVAQNVLLRVTDEALIRRSIDSLEQGKEILPVAWQGASLAGGNTGVALLASYAGQCLNDSKWDMVAHQYLTKAVNEFDYQHPTFGLFDGVCGIPYVAVLASPDGAHYSRLKKSTDDYLVHWLKNYLPNIEGTGCSVVRYDLVSGIVGIVAYILSQDQAALPEHLVHICQRSLCYLVSQATSRNDNGLPYFITPENIRHSDKLQQHPYGYSDCGVAHGIAGVIAVMALALRAGWTVPGLKESVASLSIWMISHTIQDENGINWPSAVSVKKDGTLNGSRGSRVAWCYGIPGIARALWLAGRELRNDEVSAAALATFDSLMKRPRKLWGVQSANLCHGLGGILQATLRMYWDSGLPRFGTFAEDLTLDIVKMYDANTLFGFQDYSANGTLWDNPRLLEGAPGIALVLLTAVYGLDNGWDRMLLLS
ncbi:MAG TPA: lanthionine synthetase C family protein [Candidatus Saccharimonadales bacterium]|nr:lanthionine synthetase C family protein [Candidatus Saccharimonadales bacterium]